MIIKISQHKLSSPNKSNLLNIFINDNVFYNNINQVIFVYLINV